MKDEGKGMNYEVTEFSVMAVAEEARDLRERTRAFALRIIHLFSSLPKTTEAQVHKPNSPYHSR